MIPEILLRLLPDGVLVVHDDGSILYANERMTELTDHPASELIGGTLQMLDPRRPDVQSADPAPLIERVYKHLGGGVKARDGQCVPVDIRHSTIKTDRGNLALVCLRARSGHAPDGGGDQSARPGSELEPGRADIGPVVAICKMTTDGRILALNEAFESLTGFRCEDWVGRQRLELAHPEEVTSLLFRLLEAASGTYSEPIRMRIRHAHGGYRTIQSVVAPIKSDEGISGVMCLMRAEPEARVAETSAAFSGEHLRLAFEHAPLGTLILGLDRTIRAANRAICLMLDTPAAGLVGRHVDDLMEPSDRAPERDRMRTILLDNVSRSVGERRWLGPSGTITSSVTISLLKQDDGTPIGWLEVVEDISERRQAELEDLAARRTALATLSKLTKRERGIMDLAIQELTAADIARRLYLSVRTVETHLARCYRKLGVRSRPEASRVYLDLLRIETGGLNGLVLDDGDADEELATA